MEWFETQMVVGSNNTQGLLEQDAIYHGNF